MGLWHLLFSSLLRVFLANGDRTDRSKARLKYVLDDWGLPRFLEAVEAQMGAKLRRAEDATPAAPALKHGAAQRAGVARRQFPPPSTRHPAPGTPAQSAARSPANWAAYRRR